MEAIRNINLITWSRYAKLLNYDDRTGVIVPEAKEV